MEEKGIHSFSLKGFEQANLQPGDIVEFRGKVERYIKGYKGWREDVDNQIEEDYKLSRPTRIALFRKATNPFLFVHSRNTAIGLYLFFSFIQKLILIF